MSIIERDLTQMFLNSCQMHVEWVKIEMAGYFYIVWKRGKKMIQSLKYQSSPTTTTYLKQTLNLNIRTILKNGRVQERNTALYLFGAEGQEIDQINLPIHKWRPSFSVIQIPIAGGKMKAKVRMKQLMQVEKINMDHSDASQEQSQQSLLPWSRKNTNFIDGYKDQMQRVRKELQDNLYYNNKLKNDRNVLMSQNLQLESELSTIKRKIKQDFITIQKYYREKIQLRESIYEEEINDIITSFNNNYEANKKLTVSILEELSLKTNDIKRYKKQASQFEKTIHKYESIIATVKRENKELSQKIEASFDALQKKKSENDELCQEFQRMKNSLETEREKCINYQGQIAELNFQNQQTQIQCEQYAQKVKMLEKFVSEEGQRQRRQKEQSNTTLNVLNLEIETLKLTIEELTQKNNQLQSELQASKNQLQFTQVAWNKEREQHANNNQLHLQRIKSLEEEILTLKTDLEIQKQKSHSELLKDTADKYEQQIQNLKNELTLRNGEIDILQTQKNETQKKIMLMEQENQQSIQSFRPKHIKTESEDEKDVIISELEQKINILLEEQKGLKAIIDQLREKQMKAEEYEQLCDKVKEMDQKIIDMNDGSGTIIDLKELREDRSLFLNEKINEEARKLIIDQQQQIKSLLINIEQLQQDREEITGQKVKVEKQLQRLTLQYGDRLRRRDDDESIIQNTIEYCDSEREENERLEKQMEEQQLENQFKQESLRQKQPKNQQPFFPFFSSEKKEKQQAPDHVQKSRTMKQNPFSTKVYAKKEDIPNESNKSEGKYSNQEEKEDLKESKQRNSAKQNSIKAHAVKISLQKSDEEYNLPSHQIISQDSGKQKSQDGKSENSGGSRGSKETKYRKVVHTEIIQNLQKQLKDSQTQIEKKQTQFKKIEQKYSILLIERDKEIKAFDESFKKKDEQIVNMKNSIKIKQTSNVSCQAIPEKFSKSTQADIENPEKEKLIFDQNKEIQQLLKKLQAIDNEFGQAKKSFQFEKKITQQKIFDFEKKCEILSTNYGQVKKEYEKNRKQWEEKERVAKDNYQDLKLQKAQVQFDLSTFQTDNKRLKNRVQDLQEKVRKGDVLQALRQAQYESQTANKKVIEQNRLIYQLRLEKQSTEDETKILKKKCNDLQKKVSDAEDLSQKLEKNIDEFKRKQQRLKREIEDKEDSIQKLRDQIKRLNDEISTMKSYHTQQTFQRKKIMDDLNNLQHLNERKEYDMATMKKQVQKLRQKLQQKEQDKIDRKNTLRKQIEQLQEEMLKKDKYIIELQSQVKYLTNKIQALQQQSKKTMNNTSQTYSEKLKLYIEQISQVKKVLQENNAQNSSLRHKLNEMYEQNEYIKNNYGKLEAKYQESVEQTEQIFNTFNTQKQENEQLKQKAMKLQYELQNQRNTLKILRNENQNSKKEINAKEEKLFQALKQNQNQMDVINKYKLKLADFETENAIQKNISEKLVSTDARNESLLHELKELRRKHESHLRNYIYSQQQMDKAKKEIQTRWKESLQFQTEALKKQITSQTSMKLKKMESQLVDLLNENGRIRSELSKKSEEISELDSKNAKLQALPIQISQLEQLIQQKHDQCNRYREFESRFIQAQQKILKLQYELTEAGDKYDSINQEKNIQKKDNKELQIKSHNQLLKHKELDHNIGMLEKQLKQSDKIQEQLKQEIASLLDKLKRNEEEKEMTKLKLLDNKKQYDSKIRSLQQKLQLMSKTVGEHQKMLQSHYEQIIEETKGQLNQVFEEIEGKDKMIEQYSRTITKYEEDLFELKKQIQNLNEKSETDADLYEMEINKMRNRLNQNEKAYQTNIQNLQSQLTQMSKQLTYLKMQKNSNTKRMKMSEVQENMNEKKLTTAEKKLQQKNSKIEEMKNNIFLLEETIVKFKRKQNTYHQQLETLQPLKKLNKQLEEQVRKLKLQLEDMDKKFSNIQISLKNELNQYKQREDLHGLDIQQKSLQLQSVKYELKTLKDLYNDLQNQLQKRKNSFKEKLQIQSKFAEEIQVREDRISQLTGKLEQLEENSQIKDNQLRKKIQKISHLQKENQNLSKSLSKLQANLHKKIVSEQQQIKTQINRLTEENQQLKKQTKKQKEEILNLHQQLQILKQKIKNKDVMVENYQQTIEEISTKCRDMEVLVRKYHDLNEKAYQVYQMSIDEIFLNNFGQNYFERKLKEKDQDLNDLIEQIEELKFLNQRKFMDYDELKRENYELQLRLEDAEYAGDQVDELREICDKLEQQKKDALWRESVLRTQMETLRIDPESIGKKSRFRENLIK